MRKLAFSLAFCLMIAESIFASGNGESGGTIRVLNLRNADVRFVFETLSDISGVNIVPSAQVTGKVNISLRDVTWRDALDIIAEQNNLVVVEDKKVIRVLTKDEYKSEVESKLEEKKKKENLIPLEHRVLSLRYSKAEDLRGTVEGFLSERGKVAVDQRTNSIIVTDIPEKLDLIGGLIGKLDRETRQVNIKAKIMDFSTTGLRELGIDWSSVNEVTGTTITQSANRVTDVIAQIVFSTKIPPHVNLDAILSSLVSKGAAHLVSEPSITTVDNIAASVFSGMQVPQTRLDEAGNTVVELFDVGTTLTVTPHITSDNEISLDIEAIRSDVQTTAAGYQFTKQQAKTSVVLSDGETAVIGGLNTTKQDEYKIGIPILMNLPLIGNIFRYTKTEIRESTLVIFITPHIVM